MTAFNTSDPLAGNVRATIAYDDVSGTVKELKSNLPLTVHADVRLPTSATSPSSSTPYGPSFRTLGGGTGNLDGAAATNNGGYRGVSLNTGLTVNLGGPFSIFIVWNKKNGAAHQYGDGAGGATLTFGTSLGPPVSSGSLRFVGDLGTADIGAGAHTYAIVRRGESATGQDVWLDGVKVRDATNATFGFSAPYQLIGGYNDDGTNAGSWVSLDHVSHTLFDKALTDADVTRLHNSVGAGTFALWAAGGGDPAPTFPGPNIADFTAQQGVAITPRDVHLSFADNGALTYSASPAGTAWPAGITINSATGIISGTTSAAIANLTGLRARATDTSSQTVDSNAFAFAITAAGGGAGSVTTGIISNNTGSAPLASTAVFWTYFPSWRGGDVLPFSAISGTGTTAANGTLTIGSGLPSGSSGELLVYQRVDGNPANDNPVAFRVTVA